MFLLRLVVYSTEENPNQLIHGTKQTITSDSFLTNHSYNKGIQVDPTWSLNLLQEKL